MEDLRGLAAVLAPTGVLRAAINLGNPVLAQGTPDAPRGITVDIARSLGAALGRPVELRCSDAARHSFDALAAGDADLAFLADEPERAATVRFTRPYVVIDGVFVVREESAIRGPADVDHPGVRVGVKRGSAYDLFLTRTLAAATVVRADEGVDAYLVEGLEVGAGIRRPAERFVAAHPGHRVVEERFMRIRQAIALPRSCPDGAVGAVDALLGGWLADGSVAGWLRRSGQPEGLSA